MATIDTTNAAVPQADGGDHATSVGKKRLRSAAPARPVRPSGEGATKPRQTRQATKASKSGKGAPSVSNVPTTTATTISNPGVFRNGSKGAVITDLLHRKGGATLAELAEATGWQNHSIRGFLSGTLKKKHGTAVISETGADGVRRYRIAS